MAVHAVEPVNNSHLVEISGSVLVQDPPSSKSSDRVSNNPGVPQGTSANGIAVGEDENARMKTCWGRAMCQEMEIPEGYQKIAVLIIKWSEHLDQLKSGDEVDQLAKLFREEFHYQTEVRELHNNDNPDLLLNHTISTFALHNDGPHNLLIVYYTGHASYHHAKGVLTLHASHSGANTPISNHSASASWEDVHKTLREHVQADVLAILDTCYASNIDRSRQQDNPRIYELFCASGKDKPTAGPGPKSFTTALISSLKALLEEHKGKPFTTRELCVQVCRHPERHGRESFIWPVLNQFERMITLVPLKDNQVKRQEVYDRNQPRAVLSLRLPLTRATLTDEEIQTMAKAFCQAVKTIKAPVKRIDWWTLTELKLRGQFANLGNSVKLATKYWKKWNLAIEATKRNKKRKNRKTGYSRSPASTRHQSVQTLHGVYVQSKDSPSQNLRSRARAVGVSPLRPSSGLMTSRLRSQKRSFSKAMSDDSGPESKRKSRLGLLTPQSGANSDNN